MELQIKNRSYKNYRVNILKFNKYKFSLVHLILLNKLGIAWNTIIVELHIIYVKYVRMVIS